MEKDIQNLVSEKQTDCLYESIKIKCQFLDTPQSEMKKWEILKQFDEGAEGVVYLVKGEDNNDYILKVSKDMQGIDITESTVCNQNLCNLFGMAPKILDFWKCGGEKGEEGKKGKQEIFRRAYVMEMAGNMTLQTYFLSLVNEENVTQKESFDFLKMVIQFQMFIFLMSYIGIFHTDYHWGNVMLTYNADGPSNPQIIDFDRSVHYSEIMKGLRDKLCNTTNYTIKDFYNFANETKKMNITYTADQSLFFENPSLKLADYMDEAKNKHVKNVIKYIIEVGGYSALKSITHSSQKTVYVSDKVSEMFGNFTNSINFELSALEEEKYGGYDEEIVEEFNDEVVKSLKSFFSKVFAPAFRKYLEKM